MHTPISCVTQGCIDLVNTLSRKPLNNITNAVEENVEMICSLRAAVIPEALPERKQPLLERKQPLLERKQPSVSGR
nr:hypothetical protein Iba_chr06cCG6560 [Ipomoea batatas]